MSVEQVNQFLLQGTLDMPGLFPRLEALAEAPAVFRLEFGLDELPAQPGVLLIRGARQYGKSTWLEGAMRDTALRHGPGTALYLDGDYRLSSKECLWARGIRRSQFRTRSPWAGEA